MTKDQNHTEQADIVSRLRENADLDEMEHCNPIVIALEREAADEIEHLRAALSQVRGKAQEHKSVANWLRSIDADGYRTDNERFAARILLKIAPQSDAQQSEKGCA